MSIDKIAGQLLNSNLLRDGVNLSVDNNLLIMDVINRRVGVNTGAPTKNLHIVGNAIITSTLEVDSLTANRIVYSNTNKELVNSANLTYDGNILNVNGVFKIDQFTFDNNSINTTGDLVLQPINTVRIETTGGMVVPVGTISQRPSAPSIGTLRFNLSLDVLEIYTSRGWALTGISNPGEVDFQQINGDGVEKVFTLIRNTTANSILVAINGVIQIPNTSYTVTNNEINFSEPPTNSDIVDIRYISEIAELSYVDVVIDSGLY